MKINALDQEKDVMWLNTKDSLTHAFDHFVALDSSKENKWHHHKWIILSVHHAASCLCNLWLKSAAPNDPLLSAKDGREAFPHLEEMIKALQKHRESEHLTLAESQLLVLLGRLNDIRNKFMHRLPPKEIKNEVVAYAATSMIGMLHVIGRRSGESFYELFDEFTDIRKFVIDAIHYTKVEEYFLFIEKVLEDQGYGHELQQCPSCGTHAIIGSHCEACFEDVTEVECLSCQNMFYIQSDYPFEQECPYCGYEYKA